MSIAKKQRSRTELATTQHCMSKTHKLHDIHYLATRGTSDSIPAMNAFSSAYKGTHFQDLPSELLQHIARHTFNVTEEQKFPNRVEGLLFEDPQLHCITTLYHLSNFRLICRASSFAGRAAFITAASRSDYLGSQTLYLPPKRGSCESLLKVFRGTGLGATVKVVEMSMFARTPITPSKLMHYLMDSYPISSGDEQSARFAVGRVLSSIETEYTREDTFYDDIQLMNAVLDCLPPADRSLAITVEDFLDSPRQYGAFHTFTKAERCGQVVHWNHLPQIFELINRYAFSTVHIDADSSLFGNPFLARVATAYPHNPSVVGIDTDVLTQACQTITVLSLSMTKYDMIRLGKYKEYGSYRHRHAYKKFLSRFMNLRSLCITAITHFDLTFEYIDAAWLEGVLEDQAWPELESFDLSFATLEPEPIATFFINHKASLRNVKIARCWVSVPETEAQIFRQLPDLLTLNSIEMSEMHYAGSSTTIDVIFEDD